MIQFVVERIKAPIPEAHRSWAVPLLAFGLSIVITTCCRVGLLSILGITATPIIVDYIFTGFILSGGSTLTNELIKALNGIKTVSQEAQIVSFDIPNIAPDADAGDAE